MNVFNLVLVTLVTFHSANGLQKEMEGSALSRIGASQMQKSGNLTILSRKRRFLAPLLSGWVLNIRLTLLEPLSTPFGSTFTQLIAFLPFTFKLDSVM